MNFKIAALVAVLSCFSLVSVQGSIPGGIGEDKDLNDVPAEVIAEAVKELQLKYPCVEPTLKAAREQVVAGMNYYLTFDVDWSKCSDNSQTSKQCNVKVFKPLSYKNSGPEVKEYTC